MFADPLTERLAGFVHDSGLPLRAAALSAETLLPGLDIRDGAIVVDEACLAHPGDILHEAGHLAARHDCRHAPATKWRALRGRTRRSATSNSIPRSSFTPKPTSAARPRSSRPLKAETTSACWMR